MTLFKNLAALGLAMTFGTAAQAATINVDLGTTIPEDQGFQFETFDVNGDSLDDFSAGFGFFGDAFIEGLDSLGNTQAFLPIEDFPGGTLIATASITNFITDSDGELAVFQAGDTVGASDVANGGLAGFQTPSLESLIPNVGDSVFLGFQIEVGLGAFTDFDGIFFNGFVDENIDTFFGFVNVERGSLLLGAAGFSNVSGSAALIPGGTPAPSPVPLPASALLLLGGLGGLGAMRRRKNKS